MNPNNLKEGTLYVYEETYSTSYRQEHTESGQFSTWQTEYTTDPAGYNEPAIDTGKAHIKRYTVYDVPGRLWKTFTYSDTYATVYAYDKASRQTTVTDPEGVVTKHVYDEGGRLEEVYFDYVSAQDYHHKVSYAYDLAGARTKTTIPTSGGSDTDIDYTYDLNGRLTKVGYEAAAGPDEEYGYDAAGNLTYKKDGKGQESESETGTHPSEAAATRRS